MPVIYVHVCVLQDSNRRCWGSPNSIGTAWRAAPDAVHKFLLATPFGLFMSVILEHVQRSQRLIAALAERWFDTTHTFHWSWGEMTMTLDLLPRLGFLPVVSPSRCRRWFGFLRRVLRLPWDGIWGVLVFLMVLSSSDSG